MNNQMIQMFQRFMQNPTQILSRRGLSPEAMRDPRAAVQQLLNNGQLSQQQLYSMQQTANNIMNTPIFRQMFGK